MKIITNATASLIVDAMMQVFDDFNNALYERCGFHLNTEDKIDYLTEAFGEFLENNSIDGVQNLGGY